MRRQYCTFPGPKSETNPRDSVWDRLIVGGAAFTFMATVAAAAIGYAGSLDQSANSRQVEVRKIAFAVLQDGDLNPALTQEERRRLIERLLRTAAYCTKVER